MNIHGIRVWGAGAGTRKDGASSEVYPAPCECLYLTREEVGPSVVSLFMRHSIILSTPPHRLAPVLSLALVLPLIAGCATTTTENEIDITEDETFRPLGPASRDDHTIGKYLSDLSISIRAWNEKTLTASTTQERRKQR